VRTGRIRGVCATAARCTGMPWLVTLRGNRYIGIVGFYRYRKTTMKLFACGFDPKPIIQKWICDEVNQRIESELLFQRRYADVEQRDEKTIRKDAENSVRLDGRFNKIGLLETLTRNHAARCRQCSLAIHLELVSLTKKKRSPVSAFSCVQHAIDLTTSDGITRQVQRCKCHQCGSDTVIEPYLHRQPRIVCAPCRIQNRIDKNRKTAEGRKVIHKAKRCAQCKAEFQPKRSTAVFCSTKCRVANHRS